MESARDSDSEFRGTVMRRAVCEGSSLMGISVPTGYELARIDMGRVHTTRLSSTVEYSQGCKEHDKCSGHLCSTPFGTIVMPHFVSRGEGILKNSYLREAERCIRGQCTEDQYKEFLSRSMMTKSGVVRYQCLGGTIDGSIRSVIIPCWECRPNEIAVPRSVAVNFRYPVRLTKETREGILVSPRYDYLPLEEGDTVIVNRPPSLWQGSCEPMVVRLWGRECIGLSPHNCSDFNADFDGDEVQIYPSSSIARRWSVESGL